MKKQNKILIGLLGVEFLISMSFPVLATAQTNDSQIQESISKIESKLEKEQMEKKKLEQSLGQIQQYVSKTQSEISQTQQKIKSTVETLNRKETDIALLQDKVEFQREVLKQLIQEVYLSKQKPLLNTFLQDGKISDIFGHVDHMVVLEEKIRTLSDDIEQTLVKIEEEKQSLAKEKEKHEDLLDDKIDQKQDLLADKAETQQDINEKDATISELQGKLSKLRNQLSDMLGKKYDAKDVSEAAAFAAKVTGVRKDFIMGMLVVESDLGRFTGGCTYGEVESGAQAAYKAGKLSKTAWGTFQNRTITFKSITSELGYDYKKQKVSCNPKSYAGTGGAMGVPQFMPDTWMGYKKSIASVTGHNPPDPWNLTDGVVAMALKLAKVPGVTAHQKTGEMNAAKIYLSGTTSSTYNWYAQKVLYWADNYEKLLGK